MKSQFILVGWDRIRISTIKRYRPDGDLKLKIYYNTSRDKICSETIPLASEEDRDLVIRKLDSIFGL